MLKESLFYGKVLLFGEYGIIQDSMGLSIPYDSYQGSLIFHSENKEMADWSNKELLKFYEFLNALDLKNELPCKLDLKKLFSSAVKARALEATLSLLSLCTPATNFIF